MNRERLRTSFLWVEKQGSSVRFGMRGYDSVLQDMGLDKIRGPSDLVPAPRIGDLYFDPMGSCCQA